MLRAFDALTGVQAVFAQRINTTNLVQQFSTTDTRNKRIKNRFNPDVL